jgi:spore coat protein CotH
MLKHKFIIIILFWVTICPFQPVLAQESPLYSDKTVPRIDITIPKEDLQKIFRFAYANDEYRATFTFSSDTLTEVVENIGFRIRGNTSRWSRKKSFKISFNTFEKGKRFYGVKKLNLNGEHNDPTVSRAKICWDIVRDFGLPAPRVNHVQLYINGEYYGLYLNVEHYNEDFVKSRFNNKGNLYKCITKNGNFPDLAYKGKEGIHYMNPGYELKTNKKPGDYNDLAHFIDVLHNTPKEDFENEINKVFEVDLFLKALAVEAITGHWDSYSWQSNNYYLYHNPETGKFQYLLYDMDNTLGIGWTKTDWGQKNIFSFTESTRSLTKKIMEVPAFKEKYAFYVNELLVQHFNPEKLFPKIDALHQLITPFVEQLPTNKRLIIFKTKDFHKAFEQKIGKRHVKYGIKPFVATRYQSAKGQLMP